MKKLIKIWNEEYSRLQSAVQIPAWPQYLLLSVIVAVVLIIRVISIDTPAMSWTAWKEIDYLYISQNYLNNGFNFFRPEVSWPAELPHVTEMELPFVPYISALLYKVFGYSIYTARSVTLVAFVLLVIYVFKLTKRELGAFTGLLSAFAAGIIPLYHPYSRYLFTEPSMLAMSVVSLYYLAEWVDYERKRDWFLAVLSLSLTFSLKLESLYILIPIAYIAFRKYKNQYQEYKGVVSLLLVSLIVPILWYSYAYYLETVGAHLFGIFRGHNKSQMFTMLTDIRWYRTMAGRIINGILGGVIGLLLFVIGFGGAALLRRGGLFFAYLISVGIYYILVAEGHIDAPYRQMSMIPAASVYIGLGAQYIAISFLALLAYFIKQIELQDKKRWIVIGLSIIMVGLIPLQKFQLIFPPDEAAHLDRWQIAQKIRNVSDDNSKLIAIGEYSKHVGGYDLSSVLYYYTGLQGWTLTPDEWKLAVVNELREKGATHLVSLLPYGYPYDFVYLPEESNTQFIEQMRENFPVLEENQDQIVFDLR